MINGRNFFDQPVKNYLRTYRNIRKIVIGQGDDYTTGTLIDYLDFKRYYELIAIEADPKAIQQIIFTGSLDRSGITQMFFIIGEAKETVLRFSKRTFKVL